MKVFYIVVVMIIGGSTNVFCQNILTSTIEWTCVTTFDAQQGLLNDEITKVVSSPTNITWYDSNDSVRYDLSITDVQGSWTNVSNNGSVLYNVTGGDKIGMVQFTRSNDKIKIIIHFLLEDGKSIYEITVNDVNSL